MPVHLWPNEQAHRMGVGAVEMSLLLALTTSPYVLSAEKPQGKA